MTTGAFLEFAKPLLDAGYSPLPIIAGQKKPAVRSWSNLCAAPMTVDRIRGYGARWPRASLGVALGFAGVIALDVDTADPAQLEAIRAAAPSPMVAKVGAKGFTAFYRISGAADIPSRHFAAGRRKAPICDLLALGTQTVLPPSPHPSGAAYRWLTACTLLTVPASDLPEAPADISRRLEDALAPWLPRREFPVVTGPSVAPEGLDLRRLTAFARAGVARKAHDLAHTGEGGRNNALFGLGAGLGRFVFHGVLPAAALERAALAACEVNGLLREDGRLAVLATLHSGMARAKDDALPCLAERRAS